MSLDVDGPSAQVALGTAAGYGALLLGMFVLLFVLPFLAFSIL
jgi:hypothetical protein